MVQKRQPSFADASISALEPMATEQISSEPGMGILIRLHRQSTPSSSDSEFGSALSWAIGGLEELVVVRNRLNSLLRDFMRGFFCERRDFRSGDIK